MEGRMVSIILAYCCLFIAINLQIALSAPATTAPARGTVDFIKYAYNLTDQPPAYWTEKVGENNYTFVDVDDETEEAIRKLVSNTWDKDKIGKGDDGRNLNQTFINVVNVKRIENPSLFSKYNTRRKEILQSRFSGVAPEASSLTGSRGPVSTTQLLSASMKDAIYTEVNEHYFFHGTKVRYVNSIASAGFNLSLAGLGQFGRGIYGAESSTKSDQYTDATGDIQQMLLVRMTLGNIYLCNNNASRLDIRSTSLPPTKDDSGQMVKYDSVMSDFKDDFLGVFREFIVYTEEQFYPEYIIEYNRISSASKVFISSVNILITFALVVFV